MLSDALKNLEEQASLTPWPASANGYPVAVVTFAYMLGDSFNILPRKTTEKDKATDFIYFQMHCCVPTSPITWPTSPPPVLQEK